MIKLPVPPPGTTWNKHTRNFNTYLKDIEICHYPVLCYLAKKLNIRETDEHGKIVRKERYGTCEVGCVCFFCGKLNRARELNRQQDKCIYHCYKKDCAFAAEQTHLMKEAFRKAADRGKKYSPVVDRQCPHDQCCLKVAQKIVKCGLVWCRRPQHERKGGPRMKNLCNIKGNVNKKAILTQLIDGAFALLQAVQEGRWSPPVNVATMRRSQRSWPAISPLSSEEKGYADEVETKLASGLSTQQSPGHGRKRQVTFS